MSDPYYLTKDATLEEVEELVKTNFNELIPIVDSEGNQSKTSFFSSFFLIGQKKTIDKMMLLGITTRANLVQYISAHQLARRVIYEPPVVQLTRDMLLTTVHLLFIGTFLFLAIRLFPFSYSLLKNSCAT